MAIYKNPYIDNNDLLYANIHIGEFLFSLSEDSADRVKIRNKKNKDIVEFQFMINESKALQHGLRLKALKINGRGIKISINIDEKTGAPTLLKDKTDKDLAPDVCKDIAILAGSFAIYALEPLVKAFGYFDNKVYIHGDTIYALEIKKLSESFNFLPKNERNKYIRKAKMLYREEYKNGDNREKE